MNPTPLKTSSFRVVRSSRHVLRILSPGLYTALFLFLLAIYLFTYTPRINSSDGLAMFATAESLVRRGALDIEQIRWMDLQQGTYGLDDLLYSRKGIGVPLGLLPLTWLGLMIPWFGTVTASLLFNVIITALTAVVLMAYLKGLGFQPSTGLIVALTFGLATLAWPYAKSLFSDPFSGLLLLAAAYALLGMSRGAGGQGCRGANAPPPLRSFASWRSLRYPFLAGLFLGWNVATRYAEALFLPVYGLLLLHYLYKDDVNQTKAQNPSSKSRITHYAFRLTPYHFTVIAAFCLPILLIGLVLITFNLSRYGHPLNTGYLPNETFSGIWLDGIIGQLFSPGRGLLLYCPILILSFWGMVPFLRRYRAEAILALSIIIIHLLLYGKWFMWHGGYAWGPRFMIPTLPFWAMFLAPVVSIADFRFWIFDGHSKTQSLSSSRSPSTEVKRPKSKILGVAFILLAILSLIPQLLSVAIDFTPFQDSLLETGLPLFARQTFFDPQYAALIGAWPYVTLNTLDLVWISRGQVNWWLGAILVANIIITGVYLKRKSTNDFLKSPEHPKFRYFDLLPYIFTLVAIISLLSYAHTLPSTSLQKAVTTLNNAVRPADAVITNAPEVAMPFAELYKGRAPVLGLNNGGFPLPDDVTDRLIETTSQHLQSWWLPNWLPPEESAIEQTLLDQGVRTRNDDFDGQRLLLFARPPNFSVDFHLTEAGFSGQINLVGAVYSPNTAKGVAFPVELQWQAAVPLNENYHVFIHLLDNNGQVVTQADGQPAQWSRPTSTWIVGETVIDRHGLWIPPDITPGEYELSIGLYLPVDGRRLDLARGEESVKFIVTVY